MGRYVRGKIDLKLELLTLSPNTTLKGSTAETAIEEMRVSSVVCQYSLSGFTPAVDDGPVMIGISHVDYTATEVEEFIENTGSWDYSDLRQQEIGKRLIRIIGVFDNPGGTSESLALNHGRPIKTKLNWPLVTGQGISFWAYNQGDSQLTSGSEVFFVGHANLWKK